MLTRPPRSGTIYAVLNFILNMANPLITVVLESANSVWESKVDFKGINNLVLRAGQKWTQPGFIIVNTRCGKIHDGTGEETCPGIINDTIDHSLYGRRRSVSRRYLVFVATVSQGNPLCAVRQARKCGTGIVCQPDTGCDRRASATGCCTGSKHRAVAKN